MAGRPRLKTAEGNKSLLWQINGKALKYPSYIYGTMHLMCAEDSFLSKNLVRVIKRVKSIYREVMMDGAGELMGGIIDLNMKNDGRLADYLTEEEYIKVRTFFETQRPGLPFELLERQHPLMLSSSLYELFLPCEQKNGTELKIVTEAYNYKKQMSGLETLEFQGQIFDSIPYGQQAKDLVKTIEQIDHFKQSMHEMLAVYKSQDLERLNELTLQDETGVAGHMDLLLYTRNQNWVQQMATIVNSQPTLFAVGAGHLGGEQGLIRLLQNGGYQMRPIENTI